MSLIERFEFIIIGGGVAGTTCAERLCNTVDENIKVLIISASPLVKSVTNLKPMTKFLRQFDVEEKNPETYTEKFKNLTILQNYVSDLDTESHKLFEFLKTDHLFKSYDIFRFRQFVSAHPLFQKKLIYHLERIHKFKKITCNDGSSYEYEKLCICTGSRPKLIVEDNEHVLGVRDTETIANLQSKLSNARRIMIVGNGGIATELVYEIEKCKVIWAVKDNCMSHVYFDGHASKFFDTRVNKVKDHAESFSKRKKYTITNVDMSLELNQQKVYGSALGPDWSSNLAMKGTTSESHEVTIEYNCEIKRIISRNELEKCPRELSDKIEQESSEENWPVYIELTNGKVYGCNFVISATGVVPAVDVLTKNNKFNIASDGGLMVNDKMQTNIKDVYAVGDACSVAWQTSPHWFQMRLWNQACQMGDYAARVMWAHHENQTISLDFCFEMFAHITKFFGYKVILLGNYDARGLGNNYQLLLRSTEGVEYVKIVIYEGRVQGALLIGETDLEETFENLILNQIDVSPFGENLINPDIDIEDYFD